MSSRLSHIATLVLAALLLIGAVGCSDMPVGTVVDPAKEKGLLSRMYDRLAGFFGDTAEEDAETVPDEHTIYSPPPVDQMALDDLFVEMDVEELNGTEDDIDGAIAGFYSFDPNGPPSCFFMQPHDRGQPTQSAAYWAEFFGRRSDDGRVSGIDGHEVDEETVGTPDGEPGETRVIFYVNGIKTDPATHCAALTAIANATGAVTIGVMNATGGLVADVWQTAWDRFTVAVENKLTDFGVDNIWSIHENDASTTLMNLMLTRARQGKKIEIWAHSQGGAVTSLALHRGIRQLAKEGVYDNWEDIKENSVPVRVVTFGSAAATWPFGLPTGPSYEHYIHVRDATPSVLGIGALGGFKRHHEDRAGLFADLVFFNGESPEDFQAIPTDKAAVSFSKLSLKRFHDVRHTYLRMWSTRHEFWNKGVFDETFSTGK